MEFERTKNIDNNFNNVYNYIFVYFADVIAPLQKHLWEYEKIYFSD